MVSGFMGHIGVDVSRAIAHVFFMTVDFLLR